MKITLAVPIDIGGFMDVDAEIIFDLSPHLADFATFAVHKDPIRSHLWNVSHIESGLVVCRHDKKDVAVRNARAKLEDKTAADFDRALAKVRERYPLWEPA